MFGHSLKGCLIVLSYVDQSSRVVKSQEAEWPAVRSVKYVGRQLRLQSHVIIQK